MFQFKTNDAHLVTQVLRGHKEHFAQLVERYLPAVRAVARAHAGSHADADDIAQETFIDAFQRLDSLRDAHKFAGWLLRIARNKACDWAAAEIRERTKREAGGASVQSGQNAPTAEQRELYDLLHTELEAMPPEQREVLALFHFAGHGTREIAGMLGISNAAVRKRLQRGREALGERMLRRIEGVAREPEADHRCARAIYGAAVGTPVAWEVQGGAGLAAGTPWSGVAVKLAVAAVFCGGVVGIVRLLPAEKLAPLAAGETIANSDGRTGQPVAPVDAANTNTPAPKAGDNEQTHPLPSGAGVVFGTVFSVDDQPAPNTTVHLYLWNESASIPPQRSDETGQFRFDGVPVGTTFYTLWATSADGLVSGANWEILMEGHSISQQFVEMAPTRPVTGTIVNAEGQPISRALIQTVGQLGDRAGHSARYEMPPVSTNDRGQFAFKGLAAGQWSFMAEAAGHAPSWFGPVSTGASAGTITLFPGNTVAGRLVSRTPDDGVADVEVILAHGTAPGTGPKLVRRTKTGSDGAFQFDDLPALSYRVYTERGWIAEPVNVTLEQGVPSPQVQLSALPGAEVRGRVVHGDRGEGVADLNVTLREPLRMPKVTKTDHEGHYAYTGVPAGDYTVSVTANIAPRKRAVTLELGDVAEGLDFTAQQGDIQLSGQVVDTAGNPMADVRVEAFDQSDVMAPRWHATDASGHFAFAGLPPVEFLWIRGHRDGWKSRDMNPTDVGSDIIELLLVMEPIAGFSGRLVDTKGQPVPDVNLSARAQEHRQYSSRSSRTTARGRFAFPNLVSGTYTVYAQMDSGPSRRLGDVVLAEGESKADVVLTYAPEPGLAVRGRIVDEAGEPVVAALVYLQTAQGGGQMDDTSDEAGRFEFMGLDDGLYHIIVQARGLSKTSVPDVQAGSEGMEVVMLPVARVAGRVTAADGRRLETFFVQWIDGAREHLTIHEKERAVGVSNTRGQFELAEVNAGTITLAAWADGYATALTTLELAGGETRTGVKLRLTSLDPAPPQSPKRAAVTTALHGLVTNARKAPITGVHLYLDHRPHPSDRTAKARATSGPDGRFRIDDVPLDTARLLAWHKDYAPAGIPLELREKPVHEVTLTMVPGGTVQGVLTGGGEPLRDAHLSIDSMVLGQRFYENIYPDAAGKYRAEHTIAGETTMNVHYKDRWYKFPVHVPEAGSVTANIDLQTGTAAIDGTLLAGEEPVEGQINVTIPLPGGGEERFSQRTTESGRFFIGELPAGTVVLEGFEGSDNRVSERVELVSGASLPVEIQLRVAAP